MPGNDDDLVNAEWGVALEESSPPPVPVAASKPPESESVADGAHDRDRDAEWQEELLRRCAEEKSGEMILAKPGFCRLLLPPANTLLLA
eukprot:15480170-Alexandrium_andersonii.AAC.1